MRVGQTLAGGAHALPNKGDGIEPENLDPAIGEKQQNDWTVGVTLLQDTELDFVELEPGQYGFVFVPQAVQAAQTTVRRSGCGSCGDGSAGIVRSTCNTSRSRSCRPLNLRR